VQHSLPPKTPASILLLYKLLTTLPYKQPLNLTLLPNLLTTFIPSTNGTTTTLSIDTTITHLSPHAVPTILRLRQDLGQNGTSTSVSIPENTIATTIELPAVTTTYRLEAITHHTTVTVTVERTMTSAVSVVVVGGSL
jgi:hypothetical protein